MARISVDHSKFEPTAQAIDRHVGDMKSKMNQADGEVNVLFSSWEGKDYNQFKQQWNGVVSQGSVYDAMKQSLESYASFLRYAEKKYKETQANAYNRAKRI